MRSAIVVAALVALAGGLAACDSDQGAGPTSVAQPSAPDATQGAEPGRATVPPSVSAVTSPVPTDLPSREDATVDARDYQQRNNFYFQSPTGNIMCGFVEEGDLGVGCQLANVNVIPPALASTCDDSPARKVAAHISGGKAEFMCVNQGFYVGEPVDGTNKGGGRVLGYGDTIIVRGAACTATEQGVRCDVAGHGFFVATDRQYLF